MKIGLVIQGPIISYGQGPNINKYGFDATKYIYENIKNFKNLVECIVISTWENSCLNFHNEKGNIFLIENRLLKIKDKDNRIRQFITSYEGVKFIKNNFNVSHVLKIRTDQVLDSKLIIQWLHEYFENPDSINSKKIIFSDSLIKSPFYLGDFIFAGKIENILEFLSQNLVNNKLHDTVGLDYVLKYLLKKDENFHSIFLKYIPLKYQIPKNLNAKFYWDKVFVKYFEVIPIEVFETLVWRNKNIREVLPNFEQNFLFYKDFRETNDSEFYQNKIFIIKNIIHDVLVYMTKIRNITTSLIKSILKK